MKLTENTSRLLAISEQTENTLEQPQTERQTEKKLSKHSKNYIKGAITMTNELKEILENSFLHDLYDALEIETDPSIIEAIKAEIKERTQ